MKRKRLLVLSGNICLVLILVALPFMTACAPKEVAPPEEVAPPPVEVAPPPEEVAPPEEEAPAVEPIVLKCVTFLPPEIEKMEVFREFVNRVNERSQGELIIKIIGGPEVISTPEIGTAVHEGIYDFGQV